MARRPIEIREGDTVTVEATVSRVSTDGAEVTIRLPLYGYPITLPINAVTRLDPIQKEIEPKDPIDRAPKRRGKLSRVLGD